MPAQMHEGICICGILIFSISKKKIAASPSLAPTGMNVQFDNGKSGWLGEADFRSCVANKRANLALMCEGNTPLGN